MSGTVKIVGYTSDRKGAVIAISLAAWEPVFAEMQPAVPEYVFKGFYPAGWQVRQLKDIEDFLESEADLVWVALLDGDVVGWIGGRVHEDDNMGELFILAVHPKWQRKGVASLLMDHPIDFMCDKGLAMMMVETGDDPGHAGSRAVYENAGFERWPVARYFRKL